MALDINLRANFKEIERKLSDFAYKQVPYATALALTALAKEVQTVEERNIQSTFAHPKPFTVKSVAIQPARKSDPYAVVYVRPIAAKYLMPYETGGVHALPGNALFNPKDIQLDQYGQLPQRMMQRLKARSDIYIGPVKTKHGVINGVWQKTVKRGPSAKPKGRGARLLTPNTSGKLKLLIRFGDALPVNKRLNYGAHAALTISRRFNAFFGASLGRAIASAR